MTYSAEYVNDIDVRITFGMIVLNGEPFTRYNLRSLYPFAHQIIVVEGACTGAINIAEEDGHSRDETLNILRKFKSEEDPDNKLIIVTAEDEGHPDGFWPGEKDEMSQAYAKRATGNYIWQVDSDEFYKSEDIQRIIDMLRDDPDISSAAFKQITFWGSLDCIADGYYLRSGPEYVDRIFKWGQGYEYVTHRPPTVRDDKGRNMRSIKRISGQTLEAVGIYFYHYSLLFPRQVEEKCDYYAHVDWTETFHSMKQWADQSFYNLNRPFRVHNVYEYPSWLERYKGQHPAIIYTMMNDIKAKCIETVLRPMEDVDRLLASPRYNKTVRFMKIVEPIYMKLRPWNLRVKAVIREPIRIKIWISKRLGKSPRYYPNNNNEKVDSNTGTGGRC